MYDYADAMPSLGTRKSLVGGVPDQVRRFQNDGQFKPYAFTNPRCPVA